jgi:hypothetical protein
MWDCPPDKDPCQDRMWSDQACWTVKSRGTKGLLDSKWVSCMHAATGERNWSMCGSVTKQTLGVMTRGLNTRLLTIVNCETHVKLYTYRGHQPPQHTNSKNPKLWKCTQACWCTVHSGWLCIGRKSTSGKEVSWRLQDPCKMSSKNNYISYCRDGELYSQIWLTG